MSAALRHNSVSLCLQHKTNLLLRCQMFESPQVLSQQGKKRTPSCYCPGRGRGWGKLNRVCRCLLCKYTTQHPVRKRRKRTRGGEYRSRANWPCILPSALSSRDQKSSREDFDSPAIGNECLTHVTSKTGPAICTMTADTSHHSKSILGLAHPFFPQAVPP